MSFLIGDVQVTYVTEKEFEGRKYYKMQAMGKDKCLYSVSAPYDEHPKEGDIYQMFVEPDNNWKPRVRVQKVK